MGACLLYAQAGGCDCRARHARITVLGFSPVRGFALRVSARLRSSSECSHAAAAQDLVVSVAGGKKVLLNKVSGSMQNGFWAVMGALRPLMR